MRLANLLAITIYFYILMGCALPPEDSPILIRIKNGSFWAYDSVKVGMQHTYSGLDTGATTQYRKFENGFKHTTVTLFAEGSPIVLDTGAIFEKDAVEPGQFTYTLRITPMNGTFYFGLEFSKDKQ